jgi:serine/threonine-protein kinase
MTTEEHPAPLSTEVSRLESEVGPHAHHPLLHLRVFEQLKRRNVFRVAVLYLVVCWLILDPVHVVFHMLDVPIWADRLVITLMAVGFPAVVIFAWVYEITPEGLKPTVEVPHGQSIRKLTGRRLDRAIIAVLTVALAYFVVDKFWISKHAASSQPVMSAEETASRVGAAPATATPATAAAPATASFAPPAHSIAVLPFVNMSGDKEQEYFSDGLTEELLNSLSRINELQVAGRTSSFYFKGKDVDLGTVARKLNVAAVLEGSVRRSARTVRITAQLINAATGFHLWSQTYDRNLGDILALQTEIADAVTSALKVTLLGDIGPKIELGGTHNPAAFDAYLRASKAFSAGADDEEHTRTAIAAYTEAIGLDPNYALAFARRSRSLTGYTSEFANGPDRREGFDRAEADARKAITLAPALVEGHVALASLFENGSLDFARANEEYERAASLAPGDAFLATESGRCAGWRGRFGAGRAISRRAVVLDPLNPVSLSHLSQALFFARRYDESIAAFQHMLTLVPDDQAANALAGTVYYALGNFQSARSFCEIKRDYWSSRVCLAVTYDKLGRHADAAVELAKLKASSGDAVAYQYAQIYAQWGKASQALAWLEKAMRLRDPGLIYVKTDPFMDSLRKEPRFQAVERALKFPT